MGYAEPSGSSTALGMTNDLERRMAEHRSGVAPDSFTSRYAVDRLIYAEPYATPGEAIQREKQIKGWRRAKKVELVNAANPSWRDLSDPLPTDTT